MDLRPALVQRANFLWAAITLVTAIVAIALAQRTATYTPDSFIYAQMMLEDRHIPAAEATAMDRRFFAKQFAQNRLLLPLVGANPPQYFKNQFTLFVNRPLYPYLSSLLFSRLGFRAMPFVSSVVYVLVAFSLFWLLRSFGPAWVSAHHARTERPRFQHPECVRRANRIHTRPRGIKVVKFQTNIG